MHHRELREEGFAVFQGFCGRWDNTFGLVGEGLSAEEKTVDESYRVHQRPEGDTD